MTPTTPRIQSAKRVEAPRFDPTLVRYSPGWLGLGATLGMLATLAVQWGGLPSAAILGATGVAGAAYAAFVEPRRPVLERVDLHLPSLPSELDGLRIGQISDMHLGHGHGHANTRWAVRQMTKEQPDLVMITGDFVSFHTAIPDLAGLLRPLQAPLGVYAVPGNHDYWEGLDDIRATLDPLGIKFLINANKQLTWRGREFWLAGVDDMWFDGADLGATLADVPADAFTLLMSHSPDLADDAATYNVDVQFSGHTHGGHLCLPGLGSFCLPLYGTRYAIGFERIGAMQLYVSRGLGGLPLRFGCAPEATIFTLKQA